MIRTRIGAVAALAAAALVAGGAGTASAAPAPQAVAPAPSRAAHERSDLGKDNKPNRDHARMVAKRKAAVAAYVRGEARLETRGGGEVIAWKAPGADKVEFTQFASTRTEKVWSILAEFGGAGPLHNQIARPDPTADNFTHWVADFNLAYYQGLFSTSPTGNFTDYYKKQSNGKFTAVHTVENWVKVPQAEAAYGGQVVEGGEVIADDADPWRFIKDTLTSWAAAKKAGGWTDAQIETYVRQFDVWDRYDQDGDGNFNEPDGYIDHFQAIHAGEGEEAGGGAQGADAIWSHRWNAYPDDAAGPAAYDKKGGIQIPGTDVWVYDYTVEPENGGLGVFVHEFGHDLGLTDYYDTSRDGANSTAYWTLMSGGSWLSKGNKNVRTGDVLTGAGTLPDNLGAHEKMLLGWSKTLRQRWYPGTTVKTELSPNGRMSATGYQSVAVSMPRTTTNVPVARPFAGSYVYWTGNDSSTDSMLMTGSATVPSSGLTVTALVGGKAEADFDYGYAVYKDPNTGQWEQCLDGSDPTAPMLLNGEIGTVGADGVPTAPATLSWTVPLTSPDGQSLVGKTVQLGIEYQSDAYVNEGGYYFDDITVNGAPIAVDGAETATGSWYSFTPPTGTTKMTRLGSAGYVPRYSDKYYLLENRPRVDYDDTLGWGPYNFNDPVSNKVSFYPYNTGMLVWLVDDRFADNNTDHPGQGLALPVDANPTTWDPARDFVWKGSDGNSYWANADFQSSDSTFKAPGQSYYSIFMTQQRYPSATATAPIPMTMRVPARPAVSTFYDSSTTAYYKPSTGLSATSQLWSVKTPHSGLKVSVLSDNVTTGSLAIQLQIPQSFPGQWT